MAPYSITVLPYRAKAYPQLKFQVRIRLPSKRIKRRFFATQEMAEAEAEVQRDMVHHVGIRALQLDNRALMEAVSAIEMLGPYKATLTQAIDYFIESHQRSRVTVQELCDTFLASREKKGCSHLHLRNLRSVARRFTKDHGTKQIATLQSGEIEDWLHRLGVAPISINSYRCLLYSIFEFAVKREMLPKNPVKAIDLVKEIPSRVGILTPIQMEALLVAAKAQHDVFATILLGGFAGLRPEEVARLRWNAIDLEAGVIDCAANVTKTARHRYVRIEPVLAAWLRTLSLFSTTNEVAKGNTLIQGGNFRKRWERVRQLAGFRVTDRFILKPHETGGYETATSAEYEEFDRALVPWPSDGLRHSYASYHLAMFEDASALALQLGHASTKMLFSNYRHRVMKAQAAAWWSMVPPSPEGLVSAPGDGRKEVLP